MTHIVEFASFWEHIEGLRKTFVSVFATIIIGMLIVFFCYPYFFDALTLPIQSNQQNVIYMEKVLVRNDSNIQQKISLPHNNKEVLAPGESFEYWKPKETQLAILSPTEGMVTTLKLSFWLGLIGTSPIWLYQLFKFIVPALKAKERKIIAPFFILSTLLFVCGISFCYSVTLPMANQYLSFFNSQIGYNMWSLSNYIDYTLILMLGNGLAFESAVILFSLVHWGFIGPSGMRSKRKHFTVGAFIVSAILTPPDVLTQILLATPLILLYEIAILYSSLITKKETNVIIT